MRERITYVQKLGDSIDPSSLQISSSSSSSSSATAGATVTGPEVQAVREERLTLSLDELPVSEDDNDDVRSVLAVGTRELHLRWVSPAGYETVSPLLARLPAGLHLFFTPSEGEGKGDDSLDNRLCGMLRKVFGDAIGCTTPAESFTSLPSYRFSHATAFQYFQPLEDLFHFISYAKAKLCLPSDFTCPARVDQLSRASALDISYDAISHALKITALWPYQRQPIYASSRPNVRTELGVFSAEKTRTMKEHELGLSGLLTVLGQDSKPSATMFSFPSRHRDAESSFSAEFATPAGLHPTLQLRLASNKPPVDDLSCSPHAYFTFPRTIFADKYQFGDALFLASKNLAALRYISQPVDLEAPEYVMKLWGSAVLIELAPPPSSEAEPWTAEVPLHLRYLAPKKGGYENIEIPYPAVFWACNSEEGTKFPNNPFERVNLGYDGLFGPRTVFWHVEPRPEASNRVMSPIRVPVLDLDKTDWVNVGTAVTVLAGFFWVSLKLLSVYLRSGYGRETHRTSETGDKKRQ